MRWTASTTYTVGLEEEVMLVEPRDGSLAQPSGKVLPGLAPALGARFTAEENRFIAARDGLEAELIDPIRERRVPALTMIDDLRAAARPHAEDLGCLDALEHTAELARENGAMRQRRIAGDDADLAPLMRALAEAFIAPATVG